ncbi:MAG TPA: hypothetical protein DD979_00410 [Gammaproteobacteria bacterium]|jgi:hypothetical protein|nr:hypothetical protein [Gammaproteobacteria bacterium]
MSTHTNDDTDIPVLKDIVTHGDPSIIKTTRLGHEVIRELEDLDEPTEALSPADINRGVTEQHIDAVLEEIVDKHCRAMRVELKDTLTRLLAQSHVND